MQGIRLFINSKRTSSRHSASQQECGRARKARPYASWKNIRKILVQAMQLRHNKTTVTKQVAIAIEIEIVALHNVVRKTDSLNVQSS